MILVPPVEIGTSLLDLWCICPAQPWSSVWLVWYLQSTHPWLTSDYSSSWSCWQRPWILYLHPSVWFGPLGTSRLSISQIPLCHHRTRCEWLGCLRGGGNHKVLLQSLPEEGPHCKLFLSILVHPGKHIWWYVSCHPGGLLIVWLYQLWENISLWEDVVVLKVKYFSLGVCGSPVITTRTSFGQINGSNDVMLGVPLWGTVLCLSVKQLKAKTNWVHPGRLGILIFGRVCWSQTEN